MLSRAASGRRGSADEKSEVVREGREGADKERLVLLIDPLFLDEFLRRIEALLIGQVDPARAEEQADPAARLRALAQSILDALGELRSELACSATGSFCEAVPGIKRPLRPLAESEGRAVAPIMRGGEPFADEREALSRKSITKAQVDRLARDAVRRAHRGYIDDDIFVAAVASGLSYRKAAQQLATRYNRSVTKRQVEGAVGRCGGLEGIRSRGRAWARLDDL